MSPRRPPLMLWLLLTLFSLPPAAQMCSPPHGLVHVHWEHQREVLYQLDCGTWAYFCEDSGWGDEEATVLCRELGYSHGLSGYIPTGTVSGLIDSIDCRGHERRLQDCVIEPASSSDRPTCTRIGTVSACHGTLPKVYLSVDKEKASEDDFFQVCVHISGILSHNITVFLQTVDGSALAGFDYMGVGRELKFVASAAPTLCVRLRLLDDGLAEPGEWFSVQVSSPWTPGNAPDDQLRLEVLPSPGSSSCTEGRVTVVRDADNGSLQLVEMCQSQGVWSPLCDDDWTQEDATVVCRELGYTNLGDNISLMMGAGVINGGSVVLECSGAETRLLQCLRKPLDNRGCHPVFVDCSSTPLIKGTETNEEEKMAEAEVDSDPLLIDGGSGEEEGDGEGSAGIGLGVVVAMAVVTMVMMASLVLVSGTAVIFCLWYPKRRKRKVIRQMSSYSLQNSLHITPTHTSQRFMEHSLYVNHHTSPPGGEAEHTYSAIFDPSPLHHEYATLELLPPPTLAACEGQSNIYHVLENGPPEHYSELPPNRPRTILL